LELKLEQYNGIGLSITITNTDGIKL
jgi:hypothetical protein